MKRQYFGDSKDSFKWDYLDFLTESLEFGQLSIAWMLTRDDGSTQGGTLAGIFPARPAVLRLCDSLRQTRDPAVVSSLPAATGARYSVTFHRPDVYFNNQNRDWYFSDVCGGKDQILFLDPDNGFEPECECQAKHVRYSEIDRLLRAISPSSAVTVFQHHRRKRFCDDFARIRTRLLNGHSAAVYWGSALMFVTVSSSGSTIERVREANRDYAARRPVTVLA